jgi:5-methylcytosine-specific restriction endonuclease McrA
MTWDNYGKYNGEFNYGWDIDHIIPLSSASSIEELNLLNNHTNLQPLCSKVNRDIKKDKMSFIPILS